jgi:DNA/RNA endonuclease YhcR with UshA esterase domain
MRTQTRVVVMFTFIVMTMTISSAQAPRPRARMYDPKTEMTVTGTILDVQQLPCMGRRNGTHLFVKTESGPVEVCTGPAAYIQQKGFAFAKGETVDVVGSKVNLNGKDVVIARQVTKDNKTLILRDAQGIPQWSGGRWRK